MINISHSLKSMQPTDLITALFYDLYGRNDISNEAKEFLKIIRNIIFKSPISKFKHYIESDDGLYETVELSYEHTEYGDIQIYFVSNKEEGIKTSYNIENQPPYTLNAKEYHSFNDFNNGYIEFAWSFNDLQNAHLISYCKE